MIIEIRKAGFVNKGAELMLYAVLEKMRESYPEAQFVMAPGNSAPFEKRCELGLLQKAWLWWYGFQWGDVLSLLPEKLRKWYGVVLDKEINIVIDASGFSYSDQWGTGSSIELAKACRRWKKNGTKVVLLPQALGPFTSKKIKEAVKVIADHSDIIFAREKISYEHLTSVVGVRTNIKMAPDFTNLLSGILPDNFNTNKNRFCLVPNYRMVDKTSPEDSSAYLPFMIKCAKILLEKNQKPFILVHEGANDLMLAEEIKRAVNGNISIIKETHPLKIKGIIGASEGTVGSRFHGLVSALSQGVPALATGWSHKYQMLFEDYGFREGLLDVHMKEESINKKIDLITSPHTRESLKEIIVNKGNILKKESEKMWGNVFKVLN
jgi:colanic acid/amylovoran biosynthesis protein